MQFELTEGRVGMKFRCKLTGEDGKIIYTKTVSALHINYEEWETPILQSEFYKVAKNTISVILNFQK